MIWRGFPAALAAAWVLALTFPVASARAADDPEALMREGDAQLRKRQLPAAIEAYRKALALAPELDLARQNLVTALTDSNQVDEAIKECLELIRRNRGGKEEPRYRRDYAALLYRQGKLEESIAEMYETLRLNPDFLPYRRDLATLLMRHQKLSEAEALWAEAVRRKPDDADVQNQYGVLVARRGDPRAASASFEKAIKLNPDHPDAHYNLGFAKLSLWKLEESIVHLKEAIRINPRNSDAYYHLARALSRMGKTGEAMDYLQQAIHLKRDSADYHVEMGRLLVRLNRDREAIGHFTEVFRHDPQHVVAHFLLGQALMRQGQMNMAIPQFRAVLGQRPEDAFTFRELAICFAATGKTEDAIIHYREAIRLRPDWPDALNGLAWLLATDPDPAVRDGAEALRLALEANKISASRRADYLDTLAAAQAEGGKMQEAIKTIQEAVELAKSVGDEKTVKDLEGRIKTFGEGKPHRRGPGPGTTQPATKPVLR